MTLQRSEPRRLFGVGALALAALALGGCDWTMFGYDSALDHLSADNNISIANVTTLKPLFTSPGSFSSPAVANGVVYAGGQSADIYAFDASGVTNCTSSPNQCSPLWTDTTSGGFVTSTPAVANGVLYAVSASGTLYAFDASGKTNCSGSPNVCGPLWTASTSGGDSSPNVVAGVVYIGGAFVEAFDASGTTNCSGTPKVCTPLWTSTTNATFTSPAVANGVLYSTGGTAGNDKLFAFSSTGTTNCSGTPKTCGPLWTGSMGTTSSSSSPAVSGGVVYAESDDNELSAFDAGGSTNCSGTPKTCNPLWTAALSGTPDNSSPAVANGVVYAPSSTLQAFDATGVTNCSGTPKTCSPLWSYNVTVVGSSPSVANGLVYIGSSSNGESKWAFGVDAFSAKGTTNCAGTPTTCSPLWTGATGAPLTASPAIANGRVYADDSSFGLGFSTDLFGWSLPPPPSASIKPSSLATLGRPTRPNVLRRPG